MPTSVASSSLRRVGPWADAKGQADCCPGKKPTRRSALRALLLALHCSAVYRLTNHRASSSGRLADLRSRRSNFWTLRRATVPGMPGVQDQPWLGTMCVLLWTCTTPNAFIVRSMALRRHAALETRHRFARRWQAMVANPLSRAVSHPGARVKSSPQCRRNSIRTHPRTRLLVCDSDQFIVGFFDHHVLSLMASHDECSNDNGRK
jgi:hypothetical protein